MIAKVKIVKSKEELESCFKIREKVFIQEQGVTYAEEFDEYDLSAETLHFSVSVDNEIIGTCRLRKTEEGMKIERVAILAEHRKNNYGKKLLEYVLDYCRTTQAKRVYLYSQETVIPFYEKLGFVVYGESFLDARIPHKAMELVYGKS